jgi:hypothetical protein
MVVHDDSRDQRAFPRVESIMVTPMMVPIPGMTPHPRAASAHRAVFFSDGTAMLHDRLGRGQGRVALQDTSKNRPRIRVLGGLGSMLSGMWNNNEGKRIADPKNFWRY